MKTFNDLKFRQHRVSGQQAILDFDNGYGVSVISGDMWHTDENFPYEVGLRVNKEIEQAPGFDDMVVGYQTTEGVTDVMQRLQELPAIIVSEDSEDEPGIDLDQYRNRTDGVLIGNIFLRRGGDGS